MSITASATLQLTFSGDQSFQFIQSALDNVLSIGQTDLIDLASGNNTLTAPVVTGLVVTRLTIIPPSGNTVLLTLTGVPIHITDFTSIGLDPTFVSIILNAASAVVGVRVIWS